jgi:energy-coupling factor transport system ATP-binding protein
MTALQVEGLTFAYEGGEPTLRDVSFSLPAGEAVVVAGRSGCGKSTLCRCLCGVLPGPRDTYRGRIAVDGQEIAALPRDQAARRVGLVFQDPDDQLICTTVEDELAFGLENLCVPPEEIRRRVDQTLARFSLTELALRDPATLSGGQKKLVTIASVLLMGPGLLLLDEPMTGLDADSRALVRGAIDALLADGCAIVAVEHDLSLAGYADRILYLRDGRVYDTP